MNVEAVPFDALDARTAYGVWRLRQDVFVVEQNCPYPDLDGRDLEEGTRHVLLRDGDELLGYARVLDDGDVWRIGRVVLTRQGARPRARRPAAGDRTSGLPGSAGRDGRPDAPARAGTSASASRWPGAEFLDDGIPHLPMRLRRG